MGHGDDGALSSSTGGKLLKLSGEISVLGASRSPGGLTRHTAQPGTTFADLATDPFACAFVVPGAHPGPTRQMRCARELIAIDPHLRDQTPGSNAIHPGNRHPTIQCLRQVWVLLPKLIESSI